MTVHTIRSKAVYVSPASYSALRAYADMEGLDTPDEAAEIFVQDRIWKEPKLLRFAAEMKKRLKSLRAEAAEWPDKQNKPCDAGDGYAPCQMINGTCAQCGRADHTWTGPTNPTNPTTPS